MIPSAFDYLVPASLEEALRLLEQHGEDAKLLAGGHSLIPLMKLRLAAPALLVDLRRVPDLAYIRDEGDYVAIGALTRHVMLETSSVLRQKVPLLSEAAGMVGDMQVRNCGTLGGSLAHADPAADLPAVIKALRGDIVVRGPGGERVISAEDFFVDIWTSELAQDEILTEIRVPVRERVAQAYEKFRARASDWAVVAAAVSVERVDGQLGEPSVVLVNVATTPVRASAVERALDGRAPDAETVQAAADRAGDGLEPSPELKGGPEYKRNLARVLTRRALVRALKP